MVLNIKKTIFLIVAIILFGGCSKDAKVYQYYTLSFEDYSFSGGSEEEHTSITIDNWSKYVDSPQYGGPLLYGGTIKYCWYDATTDLYSEIADALGTNKYDGGGIAISNYFRKDITQPIDYTEQLSVYASNGNNKRSAVVYVAKNECPPALKFKYGTGIIDNLYICPTAYSYYIAKNGTAEIPSIIASGSEIKIIITGYDALERETGVIEHVLYRENSLQNGWKRIDTSILGLVKYVTFQMYENDSDMQHPAYFAIDNITIKK
ncbi:MAG: DUF4465 domain-containing protein [Alistipes sp.]|nr:DUF4465 domain-containing protein [Candidatus Alistipes equi]